MTIQVARIRLVESHPSGSDAGAVTENLREDASSGVRRR